MHQMLGWKTGLTTSHHIEQTTVTVTIFALLSHHIVRIKKSLLDFQMIQNLAEVHEVGK